MNQNFVTVAAVLRTVQLQCTVTVGVQTEISELSFKQFARLQCTVTLGVQTELSELSVTQFAKLPSQLLVRNYNKISLFTVTCNIKISNFSPSMQQTKICLTVQFNSLLYFCDTQ